MQFSPIHSQLPPLPAGLPHNHQRYLPRSNLQGAHLSSFYSRKSSTIYLQHVSAKILPTMPKDEQTTNTQTTISHRLMNEHRYFIFHSSGSTTVFSLSD